MDEAEREQWRALDAQADEALRKAGALRTDAPAAFPLTDAGNAERFVARHGTSVRFVHGWSRWLISDESRWAPDDRGDVRGLMVETVRSMLADAAAARGADEAKRLTKHAITSERRDRIMAALDLASSLPPVAILPEDLDRNPDLLNAANGVIHLPTGRLWTHGPARLLTKIVPVQYDPAAEAPTWSAFLERVQPDPAIRSYLQRAAGYSATGRVSEHVLFFHHGGGANGKSTKIETLRDVLGEGEYAKSAQPDLLLAKRQDRHSVELADLRGMRLVSTIEAGEGRSWDESRVKWLTGGDTISARLMYGNPFSFSPSHKFWIAANHRPRVNGTDVGFWRRVHMIPWSVTIPEGERDRDLRAKLRAELPGILRWIVEGAVEWYRGGLRPPSAVLAATQEYRQDEDVLGAFLDERCTAAADARVDGAALYAAFRAWADASGERQITARAFGDALEERGFGRKKANGRRWFVGLGLRTGVDDAV
jgi:putative DNA primase/helicase